MNSAARASLLHRLTRELAEAENEHRRIQDEINRIIRERPSGVPLADGEYRVIQAGKKARFAYELYQQAFRRFDAYVKEGIIPEDLAEKFSES